MGGSAGKAAMCTMRAGGRQHVSRHAAPPENVSGCVPGPHTSAGLRVSGAVSEIAIGQTVTVHGRPWLVTDIRETNEDEWFACRELRLVHGEGVGQVIAWEDQCVVRPVPPHPDSEREAP